MATLFKTVIELQKVWCVWSRGNAFSSKQNFPSWSVIICLSDFDSHPSVLIKTFCWRYTLDFLNLSEGECLAHPTRKMITFRWQNSQWVDLDPGGDCNYLFKIYSWHLWSDGRELWKYVLWLLQWTFSEVWCLTRFREGGMTNGLWGAASFI